MNYLAVMPVIDEETTDRCLASMSAEVKSHLLIIDNSADGFAGKYEIESEHHPENIGVGRAWNIGARRVIEQQLDFLVIVSATMLFTAGMDDFIQHLELTSNFYGLETQHAWHCIALGRRIFEAIGLFDENFYPGYYEDSDFIRRMELAGIHNPMSSTARLPKVNIHASYQGNAHALRSGVNVNMGACREYFIKKWGYEPRYDSQRSRDLLYAWPFNNPDYSLDFWPEHSVDELKEAYDLVEEPALEPPAEQEDNPTDEGEDV